jgi:ankyrin repeat protein
LADGADVNAKVDMFDRDRTSLHFAASGGYKEIVQLLISKSADVNAKDDEERTPLHYAAYKGHKEMVELLIAEGADENAKGNDGVTPLDLATLFNRSSETADLLRKHGGKTGVEFRIKS